jgi:hypothetical protein
MNSASAFIERQAPHALRVALGEEARKAPEDTPYIRNDSTRRVRVMYSVAASRSSAPLAMFALMSRRLSERP